MLNPALVTPVPLGDHRRVFLASVAENGGIVRGDAGVVVALTVAVVLPTILEAFATTVSAILALLGRAREIFAVGLSLDDSELIEAVAREIAILTPHSQESLIDSGGNLGETFVKVLITKLYHILHHLGKSIDLRLHRFLLRLGIINIGSHLIRY